MSQINTNAILDASGGTTTTVNGFTPTVSNMAGRNRIINGGMVLDQRNAGALQTGIGNNTFITDRFSYQRAGLGISAVFNCQQSTTAPTGFGNSAYLTATTGQTLGASGGAYMMYRHVIEGFNIADALRSQSNVTISFWTYFSNSGTYSLVATNAVDRSYATTYTVTTANTWQQITLTIPLNASGGTWNYTNGIGLELRFTLDAHDDVCTASNNAWVSASSYGASGQTHGKVTTGATFYITGVQLEAGSVATPFEHRQYGQELALCQRYFEKLTVTKFPLFPAGNNGVNNEGRFPFHTQKRAAPTVTKEGDMTLFLNGSSSVNTDHVLNGTIYGAGILAVIAGSSYSASTGVNSVTFLANAEL